MSASYKLIEALRRYQAGDNEAAAEILFSSQIQNIVGSNCVKYIPSYELEEVTQIAYEIILTYLKSMRIDDTSNDGRIISLISKVLPNMLYKGIKKQVDGATVSLDEYIPGTDIQVVDTIHDYSPSPEEAYIESETKSELRKAICKLTPNQQEVILLYYYENMTVYEIAQELSISPQAAHRTLQRALEKLKEYML